ncbi:hypothetical protein BJ166DRAFT_182091 [Pestalotiopsis sp. NC0098]|nr:hypothetical protein BJ166DRAFT_182091 [Pestalotiopsis sp. NC0098]
MATSPAAVWSITAAFMFALGSASVILRFIAIRLRGSIPKTYDYLTLLAYFGLIAEVAFVSYFGIAHGGYGEHIDELSLERIENSLKGLFSQQWIWSTSTTAFRLAILLLYKEVFFAQTVVRRGSIILIALVITNELQCVAVDLSICRPIRGSWDLSVERQCGNILKVEIASAVINMVIDILVTFLPLPVIWNLQLSKQKKFALTGAFSVGICAAGANLGRLIWTLRCPESDTTFCLFNSTIFVLSEITLGVVVASVPTLGPIYYSLEARWGSSNYSKQSDNDVKTQRGHLPTIGSIPLRPQRKQGVYNDDSLLRSQPELEQDANDWPSQQIVPQALSGDYGTTAPHSIGHHWRAEANGNMASHSANDRRGQAAVNIPQKAIIRNMEYNVDEAHI